MRPLFLSLVTASLLVSSQAFAISDDGKQIVESIGFYQKSIDLTKKPFANDDNPQDISSMLDSQYGTKLKTVQERLAKVPAADRTDPAYLEKAKWAASFDTTLKSWRADAAKLKDARASNNSAEDKYKEDARSLGSQLTYVKAATANTTNDYTTEMLVSKFKDAGALTAFAERCNKDYATLSGYFAKEKADNCALAQTWRKVLVPFSETRAKKNVAQAAHEIDTEITNIKEGHQLVESFLEKASNPDAFIASVDPTYTPLFTAIGRPKPADLYAPIKTAAAAYPAAITEAVSKYKYKAGGHSDATVTAAIKKDVAAAGLTALKVSQTNPDWSIHKEGSYPVYRYRDSVLLAQVKGEKFCRLYGIGSRQEYAGGGKYSGNTSSGFDRTHNFSVAACK